VVKNKIAPPFRKAELDIIFGKGVSASASLLEAAVQCNVVEKAGSWYSYGKERIGQGADNARLFLESNPPTASEIEGKVRGILFPRQGAVKAAVDGGSEKGEGKIPDASPASVPRSAQPKADSGNERSGDAERE
jgi:recombination protein RecA